MPSLKEVFPSQSPDINTLVSLFTIANTHKNLSQVSFRLLAVEKPRKPKVIEEEVLSTKVTKEDLAEAVTDEFGAKYSKDGKRLLKGCDIEQYKIKEGTKIICDRAFSWCSSLQEIAIPNSVTNIGFRAFVGCRSLREIAIPNSVTSIGDNAFWGCSSLRDIAIPNSVTSIGNGAFYFCESLQVIALPDSITSIGNSSFHCCSSLQIIIISQGSRAKFEKLLPDYKYKLVER